MRLYYGTNVRLPKGDHYDLCLCEGAEHQGVLYPHIAFCSEPLMGVGRWVYELDIPESVVQRFECKNPFRAEDLRYYALSPQIVNRYIAIEHKYHELMGSEWNELPVVIHDDEGPEGVEASKVWISHPDVATSLPSGLFNSFGPPGGKEVIIVHLTDSFDLERDYVIQERRAYGGRKWQLLLLAGVLPAWAKFPSEWGRWVQNPIVQKSAEAFIIQTVPEAAEAIRYVHSLKSKVNKIRAWRIVGEIVGRAVGHDLGLLPATSWTSVAAMPLRIANRMDGWVPPVPQPEYEDPDKSNRVLLVTPKGSFTQEGFPEEDSVPLFQ
jgi:hypothetical protein